MSYFCFNENILKQWIYISITEEDGKRTSSNSTKESYKYALDREVCDKSS